MCDDYNFEGSERYFLRLHFLFLNIAVAAVDQIPRDKYAAWLLMGFLYCRELACSGNKRT